ncbi:MAG: ABC transporter ATP-binding protein [Planctomycetota bacterium]
MSRSTIPAPAGDAAPAADRPLLDVQCLQRRYGKVHAVKDLSFQMRRGQITGFVGPNGAGKTTTMRIAATLDVPDGGDVLIDGVSVLVEPRLARMRIGYMSDQFHPYPNLDILEYLDFFARAYGLKGAKRKRTVASVAEFCGLMEFRDRPATGLSKGMGQRLHLAKTLLHDPQLLILDEPASGLDPRARIEFRELLKELASAGKGVLISSHILRELGEMCDSVVVIEKGQRVVAGTIADIHRDANLQQAVVARALDVASAEQLQEYLATQPHVERSFVDGERVRFGFVGDDRAMSQLLAGAIGKGLPIVEFARAEADLEDIFLKTTKGQLQ